VSDDLTHGTRFLALDDDGRDAIERQYEQEERRMAGEEAPGWTFRTLADAYEPRDPLVYVVDGLFPLPSLSIVYGSPGTFKSLLLAEMCCCVAAGRPWLEPLPTKGDVTPVRTTQAPVLWLDFDNGERRTDERMEAIGRARKLPADTPIYYAAMPFPWLDASAPAAVPFLVEQIGKVNARLVVVDNLGVTSGKADENSAEMVQVLSAFRRVAEETGAAIILVHHQRKTSGFNTRAGESLRGHSSIEAAIDLALLVEREEHAESAKMKSTKARGDDVLPFGALWTYEHKSGTRELKTARFWGTPVEDVLSDAAIDRVAVEILRGDGKLNQKELADQVKERLPDLGVNRIKNRCNYLADQGTLLVEAGDHGAKLYSVPERTEAASQLHDVYDDVP